MAIAGRLKPGHGTGHGHASALTGRRLAGNLAILAACVAASAITADPGKSTGGGVSSRREGGGLVVSESTEPGRATLSGPVTTGETAVMDDAVRRYRDEMDSEQRPMFDRLHQLVVATCPDAELVLSYGMPTYRIGRRRLNIGAWKHGLSLYVSPDRDGGFAARHPELAAGKGTIKLRPEDAARISDEEFRDLVRAALRA
jgi:hypothetical protein